MAISEAFTQSALSVSTTELSLTNGTSTLANQTTDGIYQLFLDASNMAKADEFRVRLYEKTISSSTRRVFATFSMMGVQAEIFVTPAFCLINGWDMSIVRIAGADRTFDASIRSVA